MMRSFVSWALVPVLVLVSFSAGRAQAPSVSGAWIFTVDTGQGSGTPTIVFKQDGEKLTGQYEGQLGNSELEGTVKGSAIEFSFTINVQGQQAPVTYEGTVDRDSMKGTMNIGGMLNGSFTARRK
jgi:hypothetical protein